MKVVTINMSEEVYRDFQEHARKKSMSASELIRTAMEDYRARYLRKTGSIFDGTPVSVGRIIGDLAGDDDLLDEMLS